MPYRRRLTTLIYTHAFIQGRLRGQRQRARGYSDRTRKEIPQVHVLHAHLLHDAADGGRARHLRVQEDQDIKGPVPANDGMGRVQVGVVEGPAVLDTAFDFSKRD